ncbi:MAG: phytoene/squalene synthase family protein [Bacteroidales bacterium]|nr:phytoene/squalene synthase family protein [Bacteroidales bacterium]MBN2698801.1 phytoene/squalene synthase family protein [Bacteroidales bacterium]
MDLYDINALQVSKLTTKNYSTSFSMGVALLKKDLRLPIYAIYGFVRVADEIVDTFHGHNKQALLEAFKKETFEAIERRLSTNPILHSFQWVVNEYKIDHELIHAFLDSMEMDLTEKNHDPSSFSKYVFGSAEAVGLMCLKVFYKDDDQAYESLVYPARKLGEAFQKINFLRDIHADYTERGRFYFPGLNLQNLNNEVKSEIERDIQHDFDEALAGIKKLNKASKLGVLVSYTYYMKLFKKIRNADAGQVFNSRYRISDFRKLMILISLWIKCKLGIC